MIPDGAPIIPRLPGQTKIFLTIAYTFLFCGGFPAPCMA
jgi:hypothetical protein